MQFDLLTLGGTSFSGEVNEVSLTAANGAMTILPHHEAFTSLVKPGAVTIRGSKKGEETFATLGGIVEVTNNHVRLLVDEAEHEDELVESEIKVALEKAEKQKQAAKDKHELHRAQQLVDRHSVRLDVARVKRNRRSQR